MSCEKAEKGKKINHETKVFLGIVFAIFQCWWKTKHDQYLVRYVYCSASKRGSFSRKIFICTSAVIWSKRFEMGRWGRTFRCHRNVWPRYQIRKEVQLNRNCTVFAAMLHFKHPPLKPWLGVAALEEDALEFSCSTFGGFFKRTICEFLKYTL